MRLLQGRTVCRIDLIRREWLLLEDKNVNRSFVPDATRDTPRETRDSASFVIGFELSARLAGFAEALLLHLSAQPCRDRRRGLGGSHTVLTVVANLGLAGTTFTSQSKDTTQTPSSVAPFLTFARKSYSPPELFKWRPTGWSLAFASFGRTAFPALIHGD